MRYIRLPNKIAYHLLSQAAPLNSAGERLDRSNQTPMEVWQLYSVKDILARRFNPIRNRIEYKVQWEGFPRDQAGWQPEESLMYIKEWLKELNEKGLAEEAFDLKEEERRVALWYQRQAQAKENKMKQEEVGEQQQVSQEGSDGSFTPVIKRHTIRKHKPRQRKEKFQYIKLMKKQQQSIKVKTQLSKRQPRIKKMSIHPQQQWDLYLKKKEQQSSVQK